jgi:hypothetical protein
MAVAPFVCIIQNRAICKIAIYKANFALFGSYMLIAFSWGFCSILKLEE